MGFANLFINIRAGTSALDGDMRKAGSIVSGFEKQVMGVGGLLAGSLSGAVGGFALAGILKSSVHAFAEQETASKRLESTLEATGDAARISGKDIEAFAAGMQDTTRFADETVIAAASVLATFNKIKGTQFTKTLSTAADIATIKGLGLTEATTLVGKALQAPEEGLSKLKKVGIIFDEQMISTVTHLTDMGKTAEAQEVILGELNARFGGAAQKDIETYAGSIERLSNSFGELKESTGALLAGPLTRYANYAKDAVDFIRLAQGQISKDTFLYGAGREPNRNFHLLTDTEKAQQLKASQYRALFNPSGNRTASGKIKNAFATFFGAGGDHSVKGDKLFDEGQRVFEATRNPFERFQKRMKELGNLYGNNVINLDTFERATRSAQGELHSHDRTSGLTSAPEAGSQEAFATIARAQVGGDGQEKELIAQARKGG